MSSLADSVGIDINYTLDANQVRCDLYLQPGSWSSIVTNLVTNAIKYGDQRHAIEVSLTISDDNVTLSVANNGTVISAEKIDTLFRRFEQGDNSQQGQGLGLAIVKQLAENHQAKVDVSSSAAQTVFRVIFPISENTKVPTEGELLTKQESQATIVSSAQPSSSKTYQLLVVEDNQELREFIVNSLAPKFSIAAVEHGQAAVEWLEKSNLPDLILCDVMMPVMDGYQLCEKLKQDPIYRYIPLFLLTAKTDDKSVKIGLALAADDYIAKPFNIDVLTTKISNQLATRDALKKHLKGVLLTTPNTSTEQAPTPREKADKLLIQVNSLLATHYLDADLKASDIANRLYVSEKTLNRKLQATCGSSISELLREYRLNQAKDMLGKGHKPKEVCFDCGFNSMSYFSRCFKDKFGYSPSKSGVIN